VQVGGPARTSCSAADHSGRARLKRARPAGVATSSWRRLSPAVARSMTPEPISGRRLRVKVVRSVASSSESCVMVTGPLAITKPSSENCEIFRPVGARWRV